MKFRKLLLDLREWTGKSLVFSVDGFKSKDVALKFNILSKEASADLIRLHQMGFLKRKRVKRRCSSKGKLCYKGFEFLYLIILPAIQRTVKYPPTQIVAVMINPRMYAFRLRKFAR